MSETPRQRATRMHGCECGPQEICTCATATIEGLLGRADFLEARVAELEAASEWRPIESAPKDGARILARTGDVVGIAVWAGNHPVEGWQTECGDCWDVDFWLPLPAPPAK